MSRIFVRCVVALFLVGSGCGGPVLPPVSAPVSAGTFGFLLNQAFDRASQLLTQAESTGNFLEAQAAGHIQLQIENARRAYADSLHLTAAHMSAQQQQLVSSIQSLLQDIDKHVLQNINEVTQRLQLIANTIPLSDHFPQATSVSGTLVDPTRPPQPRHRSS
jgi:hypothetical protein